MSYSLFVRCVGVGKNIYQTNKTKAYDHRLIVVLQGEGSICIDKEKFNTSAGQVYLIMPGTPYRVCCLENQEIAVINFDTSNEYDYLTEPILSVNASTFDNEQIIKTKEIPFIRKKMSINNDDLVLLYRMYDTYLRNDLTEEVKNFCLSSQLAYILAQTSLAEQNGDDKPSLISSAIYKYIVNNAHSKITVSDVARHFNYSTSFIEKTLRKNYNASFKQLIIDTRLKKALWLLKNTDLTCSEIANRLGFSSGQHLTCAFAKKYGARPSDYR